MPRHRVTATAEFSAPAGYIHALLADYRVGHQRILPPRYFRGFTIERGGIGAGTLIRFAMPVLGRTRWIRASVSEPEPGRVLLERDLESGAMTTFTVDPLPTGGCRVTIATDITIRAGVLASLARVVTGLMLHRVFREELAMLRAVASDPALDDGWSLPLGGVRGAGAVVRHGFMQTV